MYNDDEIWDNLMESLFDDEEYLEEGLFDKLKEKRAEKKAKKEEEKERRREKEEEEKAARKEKNEQRKARQATEYLNKFVMYKASEEESGPKKDLADLANDITAAVEIHGITLTVTLPQGEPQVIALQMSGGIGKHYSPGHEHGLRVGIAEWLQLFIAVQQPECQLRERHLCIHLQHGFQLVGRNRLCHERIKLLTESIYHLLADNQARRHLMPTA